MKNAVKPIWLTEEKPATCVIFGGGPSLRGFKWDQLVPTQLKFITINDSWRILPSWLKAVNYFCDASWWSMQMQKNPRSLDGHTSFHDLIYRGNWITGSNDPMFTDHPQVNVLNLTGQRGLELDRSGLRHGSNSGYQAINLAVNLGAKRIILLGYDMKVTGLRTNWHDEARPPAHAYSDTIRDSMLPHFPSIIEPLNQVGVEVINATPDSELKCFPMMSLKEALIYNSNEFKPTHDETRPRVIPTIDSDESNGPIPLWEDEMLDWRS